MIEKKSSLLSLPALAAQTWKLLLQKQRSESVYHIVGSIIQALLEVFSMGAAIPLFFYLVDPTVTGILSSRLHWLQDYSWPVVILLIIGIFAIKNLAALFIVHRQSRFIHDVFITLSEHLYKKFYAQSWINYVDKNSAEIVRKIKHTPSDFSNYVLQGFLNLITDGIILILTTSLLIVYDYQIVISILIFCAPIVFLFAWIQKKIVAPINISFRELTPQGNIILTQGIDSFAEAKVYQKESFFIRHFMEINRMTSAQLAKLKFSTSFPARFFETVSILCFTIVIVMTKVYSIQEANILVLLGLLSAAIYRVVPSLNRIFISLSQIRAYAYTTTELGDELLNDSKPNIMNHGAVSFREKISLQNISFSYTENSSSSLLLHLNVEIKKGDFIAIEGPSGAGKTTLLHILTGLINTYEGTYQVDTQQIDSSNLSGWQHKLSFVPQATIVLQATILENVAFGEEKSAIRIDDARKALQSAGLYDFVMSMPLKLDTAIGESGLTLSGGQRQRLVLARALYREPEVLLLDEVTNQLDEENKVKILEMLKGLSEHGVTIILSSHDSLVKNYASRTFRLQNQSLHEIK